MATLASTIVLATLKPSVIAQFNELVNIKNNQGWEAATNKAIEIATDFGFVHDLPHPSYAIAMIGMNTNHNYTYVEEAVRDLAQGFDCKSGNCCYEYEIKLDKAIRVIPHPNFDEKESYMLNLVNKNPK